MLEIVKLSMHFFYMMPITMYYCSLIVINGIKMKAADWTFQSISIHAQKNCILFAVIMLCLPAAINTKSRTKKILTESLTFVLLLENQIFPIVEPKK